MSLNIIQHRILQPFIDESLANLKSMAGMNGHTDAGFIDKPEQFRFKGYAICAETQGCIDGVMVMHHYIETAVAMGNAVRLNVLGDDQEFDEINDVMSDALAEWGNTVLGRATRALGSSNLNISFEPPYFVYDTDTMKSLLMGVTEIITVPVHVDQVGRFYFNYLIRSVNSDVAELEEASTEEDPDSANCVVSSKRGTVPLGFDKKIMIVDDMKMVRTSLRIYLKELGYKNIIEAENGKDAVDKHTSEQPDLIFMDFVMPEMNGNEALRMIRASSLVTPVVMLTSVADKEAINECESLGIDGYIIKPLTKETGPRILARFLRQ
jgi:two-component system, response regulator PdtaR